MLRVLLRVVLRVLRVLRVVRRVHPEQVFDPERATLSGRETVAKKNFVQMPYFDLKLIKIEDFSGKNRPRPLL